MTVPAGGGAQGTHMALRWILALPQAQPTSLLCLALPAAASVLHQFPCLLSCWDPMPAGPRPSCQAPTGAPRLLSICRPDRSLCGMEGRRTSRGAIKRVLGPRPPLLLLSRERGSSPSVPLRPHGDHEMRCFAKALCLTTRTMLGFSRGQGQIAQNQIKGS